MNRRGRFVSRFKQKQEYLSVKQVAAMFGKHPRTIINWWRSEKSGLQAWMGPIGDRGICFTAESVEALKQRGMVDPCDLENSDDF